MYIGKSKFFSNLKRFRNSAGFIVLLLVSVMFAVFIKQGAVKAGALILIGLSAPILIYGVIAYPKFGIVTILISAYLLFLVMRLGLTDFPLGTLMDGLLCLLLLGLIIKQKYEPDWAYLKSPISIIFIIWIGYNLIQVINPTAESKMAWLYTIRTVAIVMLNYFIFSYHIRSIEFVRLVIKVWMGLGVFAALYGFKQQHIGFFGFEQAYLYSDPGVARLLFIDGVWRKFGFFSDPVAFSYNMVMSSLLCVGIMTGPISMKTKWILGVLIGCFLANMLYSGTRGAYVLFPAAIIMLSVILFNKKIMIFMIAGSLLFGILIAIPTGNPTLYRFQSAFKPSDDASFNVRAANQKMIQPYIRSHPLGGGLGATGVWGAKFAPWSFLASFPPDSGYVRVAVELGWIGLILFCLLMFIVLKTGIENYYKMKDPELKSYCLAMILIVFALNIGNYPQEALVQYPSNVLFYLAAALINITYKLDKEKSDNDKILIDNSQNLKF